MTKNTDVIRLGTPQCSKPEAFKDNILNGVTSNVVCCSLASVSRCETKTACRLRTTGFYLASRVPSTPISGIFLTSVSKLKA